MEFLAADKLVFLQIIFDVIRIAIPPYVNDAVGGR
jgi:hypothetical protein